VDHGGKVLLLYDKAAATDVLHQNIILEEAPPGSGTRHARLGSILQISI
jgi:hypothetical protein